MKISGGLYKTSRTNAWRCKMEFVRYNGGTQSYHGCTEPDDLVVGKIYELINADVWNWHTDYTIKGVKGKFNSVWFDKVPVYKAFATIQPSIGQRMSCVKVEKKKNGTLEMGSWHTTEVREIEQIEKGILRVFTRNSVYVVMMV